MQTVLEILKKTEGYFAKAGIAAARLDAEWLLAHALGCKRLDLFLQFDRPLKEAELAPLREMVKRRARREPLQHIIGHVDFCGLRLTVGSDTLIPRPETELLVERIVEKLASPPPQRIADLGTGSGALALALASAFPSAGVHAVDASTAALEQARANAAANHLTDRITWHHGDWCAPLDGTFDLIVSNPPYLSQADWEAAEPEVRLFEPRQALVAEDEGCADLLTILEQARRHLKPGGLLALETNIDHHPRLLAAAAKLGYTDLQAEQDCSGRPRFLFLHT
ncbi:MAG: peptide chain release factor N(5)-glutamine methyltransferase [Opitutales bacterium]|nr:peptide chain release factor N(5)-glutamine methyltransferase [Opitutales bacterium]